MFIKNYNYEELQSYRYVPDTAQKCSFSLGLSSVNVVTSTENCEFGHIY